MHNFFESVGPTDFCLPKITESYTN